MLVLSFLATALYWPHVEGAVTTPRWALLAIVVPWFLHEQRLTAVHIAGGAFLAWAALTMLWNPAPLDGMGALLTLFVLAVCFCLGSQLSNLQPLYIGAALGITVSSIIAVVQFAGFHPLLTITPVSGLFANGDFMAEAAALVLVAVVSERIWWAVPGLLPALVLPFARGAALACAVALLVHFRGRKGFWFLLCAVPVAVALYALVKGDDGAIADRLFIWRSAFDGITLFGHGVGSFWSTFPLYDLRFVPLRTPEFAHNEFLNVAFELGIVGLVLFAVFCLMLIGPLDTPRLVLIALLVESCFAFPLHEPTTAFLGMVVAGYAVWNRYLLRDLVAGCRRTGATRLARG